MSVKRNDVTLQRQHLVRDGIIVRFVYDVCVGKVNVGMVSGPSMDGPWQVMSPHGEYLGTVESIVEARGKLNV